MRGSPVGAPMAGFCKADRMIWLKKAGLSSGTRGAALVGGEQGARHRDCDASARGVQQAESAHRQRTGAPSRCGVPHVTQGAKGAPLCRAARSPAGSSSGHYACGPCTALHALKNRYSGVFA